MYSDSVDESATVGCFFAAHDTAPPAKQNKYPPTDFLSTSPPQFASLYALISNPTFPSNIIPRLLVPWRYLKTRFAAASCSSEGWLLNCEIWDVAYSRSVRVESIAYMRLPTFD